MNSRSIHTLTKISRVSRWCPKHERPLNGRLIYPSQSCIGPSPVISHKVLDRDICTSPAFRSEENFLKSFVKKVGWTNINKAKLKLRGFMLYESIVDQINYVEWFAHFKKPDVFFSWFLVTELHVWMLMVRCMSEGQDGRFLRNCIVEAMWSDSSIRAKKIQVSNVKMIRETLTTMSEQFQAALIGYDEGLLTNDVVLASALWRRFFEKSNDDAILIENAVKYIRKHIHLLESIPSEEFLEDPKVVWTPLKEINK